MRVAIEVSRQSCFGLHSWPGPNAWLSFEFDRSPDSSNETRPAGGIRFIVDMRYFPLNECSFVPPHDIMPFNVNIAQAYQDNGQCTTASVVQSASALPN
jgi:hypothetical protein